MFDSSALPPSLSNAICEVVGSDDSAVKDTANAAYKQAMAAMALGDDRFQIVNYSLFFRFTDGPRAVLKVNVLGPAKPDAVSLNGDWVPRHPASEQTRSTQHAALGYEHV